MSDVTPFWQTGPRTFPGTTTQFPVMQHSLECSVLGRPMGPELPRALRPPSHFAIAVSADGKLPPGVPDDLALRVETEDGVRVAADRISLRLVRIPDWIDPEEIQRRDGLSSASRDIWLVSFSNRKQSDAARRQELRS